MLLSMLTAAALATTTWTLDAPSSVEVGDAIPVRLTITNHGDTAVRVPADLREHLSASARYVVPGGGAPAGVQAFGMPEPISVDSLSWTQVGAGATHVVDLGVLVAEGALVGTYFVQVRGAPRLFLDPTHDLDLTAFTDVAQVAVDARFQPHTQSEVPAQISRLSVRDGELIAAVHVVNTLGVAVWVPASFLPQCEGSAKVKRSEVGLTMRTGAGGQSASLAEDELVLLGAGQSVEHEVNCGAVPAKARSLRVKVSLTPAAPIAPRLASSSRHVLEGTLTTPNTLLSGSRLESD